MTAEELYDVLVEMKVAINEERKIYQGLLSEHDDLLSLVAQQDRENSTLQNALFNYGGKEAVEEALKELQFSEEKD